MAIMNTEKEKLRIDKYLWSIRVFKSRSIASEACEKGRVKLNGLAVKASKGVNVGEQYEVRTEAKNWVLKVTALLHTRVQYSEAVKFYEDLTPPEDKDLMPYQSESFYTGKRLSKVGRPTKKERRNIEGFMEDDEATTDLP
jgi:ribosome-associated heat shock protein Hsp15